jgi:DNA repair exonuclease SbcCD ATPase subunit
LQKIADINTYFDETITSYPELIDEIGLTTIYDNRWENITASMKSVKEDIKAKLDKIQADITLIKSMPSDKTEEALRLYWGDLDVTKAITMINRYEQQKKEIEQRVAEQRKKEQEEAIAREVERARQAEREAIEREKQAEQKAIEREKQARQAELDAMAIKKQDAEVEKRLYGIEATEEEFEQVEMYLNSLGILFERV